VTTIKFPQRMAQNKDFKNLKINGYTPSDIDVAYEIGGRVFIFGELKLAGVGVPRGQALLLQRMGEALHAAKKSALVFVAEHNTDASEPIDVGNLGITSLYATHNGYEYHIAPHNLKVNKAVTDFLNVAGVKT